MTTTTYTTKAPYSYMDWKCHKLSPNHPKVAGPYASSAEDLIGLLTGLGWTIVPVLDKGKNSTYALEAPDKPFGNPHGDLFDIGYYTTTHLNSHGEATTIETWFLVGWD